MIGRRRWFRGPVERETMRAAHCRVCGELVPAGAPCWAWSFSEDNDEIAHRACGWNRRKRLAFEAAVIRILANGGQQIVKRCGDYETRAEASEVCKREASLIRRGVGMIRPHEVEVIPEPKGTIT